MGTDVRIIQGPGRYTPYPWREFYRWLGKQGYGPEQVREIIDNGEEPVVKHAVGFTLDLSLKYPGLPSLEGISAEDFVEPGVQFLGDRST